ncbi:radical SAM protein [candidate division KSB1 bacterium]|nr:MAG: radical SAM protein [candidate division KSB1 bacterium]
MYKYIFGPVPSRRLGISLGIDLVPPKTCQLNCIYCECGRTTNLTLDRKEYVPVIPAILELKDYLDNNPLPDYVTFSGAGEPTLNSGIGRIIETIKEDYPAIKIAVLTNGTSLYDTEVRKELLPADVVLPSLDAVSENIFKKINRPHSALEINRIIEGLSDFRNEFKNQIWLEIFIVPGLNDSEEELALIKGAVQKIKPDRIQLNTLDRPGAVHDIRAATREELLRVMRILDLDNTEIVARAPRQKIASYRKDIESAILETIARRPMTVEDIAQILGLHTNEINKYLDDLEHVDKIQHVIQQQSVFYKLKSESGS